MTTDAELAALEPRVAGEKLEGSITDHVRALHVCIGEEQAKANPDNALIGVLCNAVRFTREHLYLVEKYCLGPDGEEGEKCAGHAFGRFPLASVRRWAKEHGATQIVETWT